MLLFTAQVIIGLRCGVPGVIFASPLIITVILFVQRIYRDENLGDSVDVLGQGP